MAVAHLLGQVDTVQIQGRRVRDHGGAAGGESLTRGSVGLQPLALIQGQEITGELDGVQQRQHEMVQAHLGGARLLGCRVAAASNSWMTPSSLRSVEIR